MRLSWTLGRLKFKRMWFQCDLVHKIFASQYQVWIVCFTGFEGLMIY